MARKISSNEEIVGLKSDIKLLKKGQDHILHRLDTVSANGNQGLENSLKDIYGKLTTLHQDVIDIKTRENAKWYNMTVSDLMRKKWFKPIYTVFILIVINSLFHQFGIGLDLQSIIKLIFK